MRRSRRWRDQVQDLGDRFEQKVEGWLEDPPWPEESPRQPFEQEPWDQDDWDQQAGQQPNPRSRRSHDRASQPGDDPWI